MRFAIGVLAVCALLVSAGGQSQDSSQLYYALQSLQTEVRMLQSRVQQLEVRQHDPRPREDSRDFEALRQQLNRMEERIGQLEGRTLTPKPPAKPEPPKKTGATSQ
jgi:BMFP domain-containing protein YqiC